MVPEDQKAIVNGREFTGPLLITQEWKLKELSICPIGADAEAKARSAGYKDTNKKLISEENTMDERTRKALIALGMPETATEKEAWDYFEKQTRSEAKPVPPVVPVKSPDAPSGSRVT